MTHFTSSQRTFEECQCGLPHVLRHPMLRLLPDPLHLEALGAFKPASDDATPEFMVRCMGDGSHLTRDGTLLGLGRVFSTERADFFTEAEALALGFPVPPIYVLIPVSDS